jgi:hypothetical protein
VDQLITERLGWLELDEKARQEIMACVREAADEALERAVRIADAMAIAAIDPKVGEGRRQVAHAIHDLKGTVAHYWWRDGELEPAPGKREGER